MSLFNVNNLKDLDTNDYSSGFASPKPQSAGSFQGMIRDVNDRIADANDAAQALATRQANANNPAWNRQGELFFDTDLSQWIGDPDGSGFDDQLLAELTGYLGDCATAGTGTFKLGGAIDVDTTDIATLNYNIPANTLNADGVFVESVGSGETTSGGGSQFINLFGLGGDNFQSTHTVGANSNFFSRFIIVRTSSGNQKCVSVAKSQSDAVGATDIVDVGTAARDETSSESNELIMRLDRRVFNVIEFNP